MKLAYYVDGNHRHAKFFHTDQVVEIVGEVPVSFSGDTIYLALKHRMSDVDSASANITMYMENASYKWIPYDGKTTLQECKNKVVRNEYEYIWLRKNHIEFIKDNRSAKNVLTKLED